MLVHDSRFTIHDSTRRMTGSSLIPQSSSLFANSPAEPGLLPFGMETRPYVQRVFGAQPHFLKGGCAISR